MYRFFAMLWNIRDAQSTSNSLALERRLRLKNPLWTDAVRSSNSGGLLVLHFGARSTSFRGYRLPGGRGVVLGTLFRRTESSDEVASSAITLSDNEATRIVETHGKHLIEQFHGRYVALLNEGNNKLYVLRDPTGAMPCYCVTVGRVTLVFSHLEDLLRVTAHELTINWRHVCAYLRFGRLVGSETGFQEIAQVQAGECVEVVDGTRNHSFLWNPVNICQLETIEDPSVAVAALGRVVRGTVQSWTLCYRSILHQLSGGLDSSVVLSCIANLTNRPKIVCLNMYTDSPEGDERYFARLAAAEAQCELMETVFRSTGKSLEKMLSAAIVPSPILMTMSSESEDVRSALAAQHGVEAIFSGQGGDNFFQRRRDAAIAAEFVHRHGLRPELVRIAVDTARMTGRSIRSVLSAAIRQGFTRGGFDPYAAFKMPPFLCADATELAGLEHIRHPWVLDADKLPWSKIQQIFDVVDAQAFYATTCNYADTVHPLISQPIIECVLRIPSYILTIGGTERALLRRAFATWVHSEILDRTRKGAATRYYYDLVLNNLDFIRELLLDGLLIKHRLLERTRVEAVLKPDALFRDAPLQPILASIFAEVWARTAMDATQRVAA